MRKIIQDRLYFVFRDSDGILGFTIRCYDGEPVNPCFLYDGDQQVFLLRRPGQIISLASLGEEFFSFLRTLQKVRFLETPEDSSEIIRQYDVPVVKIDSVQLSGSQIIVSEECLFSELPCSA